ncbi:uncharacterized protein SPAPADRAFT_57710 [Spathaspora passalidarum NRRL Y-27907]|uniref:Uncharacterized protein n=1 Tax=Spathaspora passalidarum (strain NRRL Y-27907 / 11-Y1) TaxID=619300 RepID=G3AGY7_SPAPN|nr:uncharacterized protein SPAPADRAFT_57710 [Spathaspora passalidarum NRRL Y-27907]EGW34660.1 hypothetical protein SPAPADRAFT_57710 [Spathaspora passalidarum NRRL Y-27907]
MSNRINNSNKSASPLSSALLRSSALLTISKLPNKNINSTLSPVTVIVSYRFHSQNAEIDCSNNTM